MASRPVAEKKYRLHNGEQGTEYDAVLECIKAWEQKRQAAEDELEILRLRLATADGHPCV